MSNLDIDTIYTDDEIEPEIDEEEEILDLKSIKKNKKNTSKGTIVDFDFDPADFGGEFVSNRIKRVSKEESEEEESENDEEIKNLKEDNVKSITNVEKRIARNKKKQSDNKEVESDSDIDLNEAMNEKQEEEYFDTIIDKTNRDNRNNSNEIFFSQLSLSRPFLRAIELMGYTHPTPIQASVIPYGLAGRDICASAVTGSGKTVAFALPFLERLLYRPKDSPAIRVLVLTPTRELATQIHEVIIKLCKFTDITSCLICGGKKDVRSQEIALRQQPDVVICTPGRMLDHLRNSMSVNLELLEVLVLDEADRLLELGFQAELTEIISNYCPKNRQTLLFSATMGVKLQDLINLALKKPIRVKTGSQQQVYNLGGGTSDDGNNGIAPRLVQEFVRVRDPSEIEAITISLILRNKFNRVIIFHDLKSEVSRMGVLLSLLKLKVSVLHGDLPQTQRQLALEKFKDGHTDILIATDVAARGLDIPGVDAVINMEMPRNSDTYVHRVGRTARAGCGGRSITLVTDERRKIMKDVLKKEALKASLKQADGEDGEKTYESANILNRTIPKAVITHYLKKIEGLEPSIKEHQEELKLKLLTEEAESNLKRAENMLEFSSEIYARPQRTWFQSEKDKELIRQQTKKEAQEEKEAAAAGSDDENSNKRTFSKAVEMARKLALEDDYRAENRKEIGGHRMSRDKKRRQAAIEAIKQEEEEENKNYGLDAAPSKAKKALKQKEKDYKEKSLSELTMKKVTVMDESELPENFVDMDEDDFNKTIKSAKKKVKVVRPKFATGGFDLDDEFSGGSSASGMSAKKMKKLVKEAEFKEFDPSKRLKKGGKIGKASFKSKGRYKRRR